MTNFKGAAALVLAALAAVGVSTASIGLPKDAVRPRILTPNGDGFNDVVYFDLANPLLDTGVQGKIYDRNGLSVADLDEVQVPVPPFTDEATDLMWDGKDNDGNAVPAGVYIYEVKGSGGEKFTGAVVVTK